MSSNVLQPNPPHKTPFSLLFFFSLSLSLSLKTCLPHIPFCKYPLSSSLSSQKTTYIFFLFSPKLCGLFGCFPLLFVVCLGQSFSQRKQESKNLLSLSLSPFSFSLFLLLFLSSLPLFLSLPLSPLIFLHLSLSSSLFSVCDFLFQR